MLDFCPFAKILPQPIAPKNGPGSRRHYDPIDALRARLVPVRPSPVICGDLWEHFGGIQWPPIRPKKNRYIAIFLTFIFLILMNY